MQRQRVTDNGESEKGTLVLTFLRAPVALTAITYYYNVSA